MENSVAGVLFNDSISANKVMALIENLSNSAVEVQEITTHLNAFSNDLNNHHGALHLILNDTTFVNQLNSSIKNIDEASEKLNENMEALQNNFLLRGYFKKQEREKAKQLKKN